MRINITLPEQLLKDTDEYCAKYAYDRSSFIQQVLREKIYYLYKEVQEPEEPDFSEPPKRELRGFCQLHFERGVQYPLTDISYDDAEGNTVVNHKLACPDCVKKYSEKREGRITLHESA